MKQKRLRFFFVQPSLFSLRNAQELHKSAQIDSAVCATKTATVIINKGRQNLNTLNVCLVLFGQSFLVEKIRKQFGTLFFQHAAVQNKVVIERCAD